jgi:uncharacterized repeat protein (TIGR01451 family)
VSALALAAGAAGILLGRPSLLLVAVVGVAFGALSLAARPPDVHLELSREIERRTAAPGEPVRVTLTVRNAGESLLPDVRVVDGVPDALAVVGGSPRTATALRPGKAASFDYTLRADRGDHEFEPVTVLARGFSGAVERETAVNARGDDGLACTPRLGEGDPLPLRALTTGYTGRVVTDVGGPGAEFHAVREYRPGDPLSRIDWRRAARTGEYATVEFRRERAATVLLLVDTRETSYLAPDEDAPSAVERSIEAAGELFTSLLSTGDLVGLAAFGPGSYWLAPAIGDEHRARARAALATDEAFSPTPRDGPFFPGLELRRLRRRLRADTQVVLFSPLCDDYVVRAARRLDAYGHPVTVLSPDPTVDRTVGSALARLERTLRCSRLREAGIRVVDWSPDEHLAVAVAGAAVGWSG